MTLIPVVVVGAAFEIFCLVHLVRAHEVRYLPKVAWAAIVLVSIPLGGIVYLVVGRVPAARAQGLLDTAAPPAASAPLAAPPAAPLAGSRPAAGWTGRIVVDRLSKHFGTVVAVDDLSFEVRPGVVTGFLGPNGAGKTTTMELVLGLETPTAGNTSVDGRPYRALTRPLHEVGSLLDASAAHPGRSAWSHIMSVAQSNGIGRRRVLEVLELTGLAEVAQRRVREFSLGMKQRLGIAVALLGDPPILLFDEPVNGLDPEGVHRVRQLFKSLAAEGRTVLVSSHLMGEMALTADHLIVIGRGRLLSDSSTKDFIEANAHHDVFVRSPQSGRLVELLRDAGAGVVAEGDDGLSVTDLEAPAIAQLASAHDVAVYELTPRHASLEEAYLNLTGGSVEFHAGTPGAPAPGGGR